MKIHKSWTDLKTLANIKDFPIQYDETTNCYFVFILENGTMYFSEIWKNTNAIEGIDVTQNNTDKTDFEDNYKTDANKSINPPHKYGEGKGVKITGQATVTGINQTIVEYTIPAGTIIYITDIITGGTVQDIKVLKKNTNKQIRFCHSAWTGCPIPLKTPIKVSAGEIIKVTNTEAITGKHIATLIGVKVNV